MKGGACQLMGAAAVRQGAFRKAGTGSSREARARKDRTGRPRIRSPGRVQTDQGEVGEHELGGRGPQEGSGRGVGPRRDESCV